VAPNNEFLAIASRDGTIQLRDLKTGANLRSIQAYARGAAGSLAISPDGKLLASSAGGSVSDPRAKTSVELWNAETGEPIRSLVTDEVPHLGRRLHDVRFSPAGDVIAARADDGLHLWDSATGKYVLKLKSGYPVYCFAPNGRFLVCQLTSRLELIELVTGQTCLELPFFESTGKTCTALSVSPDGLLLAVGTSPVDGVVLLSLVPPDADLREAPTEEDIAQAWAQLAESDASAAYKGAWVLATAGDSTIDFLRDRLASVTEPNVDPERIAKLVADLDDDHFEVRERATTALQQIGPRALPHIKQTVTDESVSTEHRLRLTRLIATMEAALRRFSGEPVRRLRAIGVLERIGTRPAGELLAELASGPPTARETLDAQSALVRLKTRLRGP
jgi:hypothetical protein